MAIASSGSTGFFEEYVRDISGNFKFRYVGLGFLWAWIYASWFTPVLFPNSGGLTASSDISWYVSGASVALTLFMLSFLLRDREISTIPGIAALAGPMTSLAALCSAAPTLFGIDIQALSLGSAVVSGVASACLWMLWGEFTGKVEQETAELFVPLCVVVPTVVVFTCSFISGPIAGFAICLLPAVSGVLLNLSMRDEAVHPVELLAKEERPRVGGEFVRVGVGSVAIYVCVSFTWGMLDCDAMVGWGGTYVLPFVLGGLAATVLAVLSISFSRKLDLFGLYRWLIPVVLFALVLLTLDGFWPQSISFALITVGHFGFDVIVWLYFCRVVRTGACSGSFAIGINRGFVQTGVILGSMVAGPMVGTADVQTTTFVALVLCALLATVSLMVLHRQDAPAAEAHVEEVPQNTIGAACDRLAGEHGLTPREREILEFLARGRSLPYIRDELVLSKNTVSSHVKSIYKKLDVHSRQELFDLLEK